MQLFKQAIWYPSKARGEKAQRAAKCLRKSQQENISFGFIILLLKAQPFSYFTLSDRWSMFEMTEIHNPPFSYLESSFCLRASVPKFVSDNINAFLEDYNLRFLFFHPHLHLIIDFIVVNVEKPWHIGWNISTEQTLKKTTNHAANYKDFQTVAKAISENTQS